MVNDVLKDLDTQIGKAMEALKRDLGKVRTGRANATMLDGIRVDYYGTPTPLNQMATVSIPDPRTVVIKPFEKRLISDVEKAIREANLGINPSSDSEVVRLPIPALTADRRKELGKVVQKIGEEARVAVRKCRREAREPLEAAGKAGKLPEDDVKRALDKIQTVIDKGIAQIDEILSKKQAEIMEV